MDKVGGVERSSPPDALSSKQPSHAKGLQIVQEPHRFPERSSVQSSTQHVVSTPQTPRRRVFRPPPPPPREVVRPEQLQQAHQQRLAELSQLPSASLLRHSVVSNAFDDPSSAIDDQFNLVEDTAPRQ